MKSYGGFLWPIGDRHAAKVLLNEVRGLDVAMEYVRGRDVCVQAGGNVGVWPAYLAKTFAEVWTFEPDLANYLCLLRNIPSGVYPFLAALGHKPMGVSMELSPDNVGAHSLDIMHPGRTPVLTIDELELQACDLIVLDCEGFEPLIVDGAADTIRKFKPVLMIEDKDLSRHYGKRQGWPERDIAGYRVVAKYRNDLILAPE